MLLHDTATSAAMTSYPTSPAAAIADSCLIESDALNMALEAMENGLLVRPRNSFPNTSAMSPISSYPTTSAASSPEAAEQQPATPFSSGSPTKSTTFRGKAIDDEARSTPVAAAERQPLSSNTSPTRASPVSHDQLLRLCGWPAASSKHCAVSSFLQVLTTKINQPFDHKQAGTISAFIQFV